MGPTMPSTPPAAQPTLPDPRPPSPLPEPPPHRPSQNPPFQAPPLGASGQRLVEPHHNSSRAVLWLHLCSTVTAPVLTSPLLSCTLSGFALPSDCPCAVPYPFL